MLGKEGGLSQLQLRVARQKGGFRAAFQAKPKIQIFVKSDF